MTLEERRKKLWYCEEMARLTLKRIRRLNTALKNWERRAKMHEKAIAAAMEQRIAELEGQLVRKSPRKIKLED